MSLRFLTFTLILALAVLPIVEAQAPALSASVDHPTASLGPSDTATITWTVTNTGSSPAASTVTITLTAPAGWQVSADQPASFQMSGGGSRPIHVTVKVADAKTVGNGGLVLLAQIPATAGQLGSTSRQEVALTYVAPAVPPPPPPHVSPWPETVAITGGVLLVLFFAYLLQARRVGIEVADGAPHINIGTDGVYTVRILNPARIPQNVRLRVDGLPATWAAAFSFPAVQLRPGERSEVPLWVKVPLEAPIARQPLRIRARPNAFSPWAVERMVDIEVVDVRRFDTPTQ